MLGHKVTGKIAVVAAAARGIGLAYAQRFARGRATVILSDVLDEAGEQAAGQLRAEGGDALYRRCDVTDKAALQWLMDFAVERCGRIDTMIANAGIVHAADLIDLEVEDFDRVLGVNLRGVFLTGQLAASQMVTQKADVDGCRGHPHQHVIARRGPRHRAIAPYIIAKGAVNQWTKCPVIRWPAKGCGSTASAPAPSTPTRLHQHRNVLGDHRQPAETAGSAFAYAHGTAGSAR